MMGEADEDKLKLINTFITALQISRGFFETNKSDVNSFKKFEQGFLGINYQGRKPGM